MDGHIPLNLTVSPEILHVPDTVFVYLEKRGPFAEKAPLAWHEFWTIAATGGLDKNIMETMAGLSRIDASLCGDDSFIYQAGILVKQKPDILPQGLSCRILPAGKYACFILTGSYSQFARAYPAAFERVAIAQLKLRSDFCIERYLNSPQDTAEENLKTEILLPIEV